jgi:hypothetical protein
MSKLTEERLQVGVNPSGGTGSGFDKNGADDANTFNCCQGKTLPLPLCSAVMVRRSLPGVLVT